MSIRDQYTDEQWNSLTEEEQEGILSMDEDETPEEEAERIAAEEAGKTAAKQNETPQQTTTTEPTDEEKAAAAAAAQQTTTTEPTDEEKAAAAAKQTTTQQQDATVQKPRGVIDAKLPEDFDARVKANEEAQDNLDKKYEDGDISFAEYRKEQRRLDKEARDLDRMRDRVDLGEESRKQAILDHWQSVINPFTKAHPELSASQEAMDDFDRLLQVTTGPVLEKGGMPGQVEIDKAYRMWCVANGHALPAQQQQTTTTTQAQKQPVKVPPTLGGLPSATQTGTEDGRWAQLDRLADSDPLAYEDALAKLSESDREAYLSV